MNRFLLLLCVSALTATAVWADKRPYVWTYPYIIERSGEVELEHYLTLGSADVSTWSSNVSVEHQVEIEAGIIDRLDAAVYQVFKQSAGKSLTYDSTKIRLRYGIVQKNEWIVDPLLYLEYKFYPALNQHGVELKPIVSKDITPEWNIAVNPVIEWVIKSTTSVEFKYNIGSAYSLFDQLAIGLECRGSLYPTVKTYLGPVVSLGTHKARISIGSAMRLDASVLDAQIRSIIGVLF